MKATYKSQLGVTLVELLVAMTISLIVLAGVGQLFVSNKQTYRSIDGVSRLQENARFAMFFLSRDVRNTDYWGCIPVRDDVVGTLYAKGVLGENDNTITGLVDSDNIVLVGAYGNGTNVVSVVNGTSDSVVTVGSTAAFTTGDNVVIGNCEAGHIETVTVTDSTTLTFGEKLIREFGTDAVVYKLVAKRYSLGVGSNGPSLFLETDLNGDGDFSDTGEGQQELVEGIEDFQLLYGVDGDSNDVPDSYVVAGTSGLDMEDVVSVRVTLTARTLEDNLAAGSRTYNGVSDRRFAKSIGSTIAIRNRLK